MEQQLSLSFSLSSLVTVTLNILNKLCVFVLCLFPFNSFNHLNLINYFALIIKRELPKLT